MMLSRVLMLSVSSLMAATVCTGCSREPESKMAEMPELTVVRSGNFMAGPGAMDRIGGTAQVMVPRPGEAKGVHVKVSLTGLSQGTHAWHIHEGSCAEMSDKIAVPLSSTEDSPGLAGPLAAGPNGVAEETVFVPNEKLSLDDMKKQRYSIHVHAMSGPQHGPTVACVDL